MSVKTRQILSSFNQQKGHNATYIAVSHHNITSRLQHIY